MSSCCTYARRRPSTWAAPPHWTPLQSSVPTSIALPLSLTLPASAFSMVVLPLPDGPMMASMRPGGAWPELLCKMARPLPAVKERSRHSRETPSGSDPSAAPRRRVNVTRKELDIVNASVGALAARSEVEGRTSERGLFEILQHPPPTPAFTPHTSRGFRFDTSLPPFFADCLLTIHTPHQELEQLIPPE